VKVRIESTHILRSFFAPFPFALTCLAHHVERLCAGSAAGVVYIWEFTPLSILQHPDGPGIFLVCHLLQSIRLLRSLAAGSSSERVSLWSLPRPPSRRYALPRLDNVVVGSESEEAVWAE